MWHMPHGISLRIAPKNSNSYCLFWGSSINLLASTTTGPSYKPALHIIIMPIQQALFHATSRASPPITDAGEARGGSHNLRASTKSIHCNSHLMKSPAFSYLASHPGTLAQIIIPEINCWLWIALATPSAPHQRCQHHIKGAPLLTKNLKGLTTHLALLLITDADALLATSTPLSGPFSSVFSALPFCCDYHQASHVPAKRPQVATSQVCLVRVIITTSVVSVYFIASLWFSFLLLPAWTAIWYHTSRRDWTPLWHSYCRVAQVPAQLNSLFPPGATLINILLLFLFIIVC